MTPSARIQATIDILERLGIENRPADALVSAYFRTRRFIGSKDRSEIAARVYAVLRHHARLGWWLARAEAEDTPRNRVIAELTLAEGVAVKDMGRLFSGETYAPIPLDGPEDKLVKATAGQPLDHPDMPKPVRSEIPDWAAASLEANFGDRFEAEVAALLDQAPLDLRVNELRGTRDEVVQTLAAGKLDVVATPLSPLGIRVKGRPQLGRHPAFQSGLIEVQDEGSQLIALLVDARPGQQVVDFCSGAGGKALALAARMKGKGRVVACDVSKGRLDRGKERLRRAGIDNVEPRLLENERDRWVKKQRGKFDRVLVDAPCSGTGAWRRNPDARWRPMELERLLGVQREILDSAARLAKPDGGRVIYATCSLLREENEAQVEGFLAAHPDYRLVPVETVWDEAVGTGPAPTSGMLRLSPAANGTDGFFVAVLERGPKADAGETAEAPADEEG
ncbi:RsmB/NOP family class I SAM-dependent RNA methyltransferase [Mycobacterium sp. KBS0706]|uniref:RsmB/NOP family class I SAM-dependent RNA methyltransferase n=1 Tax=Mycobacterium sp. KBS0706 TaxID=2578109 RepID=UPI00110FC6A2|nr:RsmB/NOP family class I SAM-dependent RNA methyltransferase [Mycobacterium sp. KBS0706]TSD88157.1 RsmB/NOP family class I SAM-dependent RNA methyltransferase [Mycobacterium sp. KBS0706]